MKICIVCKVSKSLSDFGKCGRYADGHLSRCKDCFKAYQNRKREELSKSGPLVEKKCPKCKQVLPVELFCKNNYDPTGVACWCKSCTNENGRKQYALPEKAEKVKERTYRRLYGIGIEEFRQIFAVQGMKCAICGDDSPESRKRHWNVDHCHTTGKVRGILCKPCNFQLGIYEKFANLTSLHNYLHNNPSDAIY